MLLCYVPDLGFTLIRDAPLKKIPGPKLIDPGISLFYPQSPVAVPSVREGYAYVIQAGLLTLPPFQRPSHSWIGTVAHKAERVPLS